MKTSLDLLKRQLEVAKSDKIELTAKLELAQQKAVNLEREN
jgi:hypothetical protein